MTIRQKKGKYGEDLAIKFLQGKNYRIINRNFRSRFGEIDLIAYDKDVLVFIEVKYRTSDKFGTPLETIDKNKMLKIYKTIQYYLRDNQIQTRFDVVSIYKDSKGKIQIELIPNAYEFNDFN